MNGRPDWRAGLGVTHGVPSFVVALVVPVLDKNPAICGDPEKSLTFPLEPGEQDVTVGLRGWTREL